MEQMFLYIILGLASLILVFLIIILAVVSSKFKNAEKRINLLVQKVEQIEKNGASKAQSKDTSSLLADVKAASASAVSEQMKHEMKVLLEKLDKLEKTQIQPVAAVSAEKEDLDKTMVIPKIETEKRGSILCRRCYKAYSIAEKECPYCKAKR